MSKIHKFDMQRFYAIMDDIRIRRKCTWKEILVDAAVAPTSLARMRRGESVTVTSAIRLAGWFKINLSDFIIAPGEQRASEPMDTIRTALERDGHMTPEQTGAMLDLIRMSLAIFQR